MRRREFIAGLCGAAVSTNLWAHAAHAQSPMPVIGFLNGASAQEFAPFTAAFRQGLLEHGYIEGQNVLLDYRWADGQYDRLPTMASDLVRRQVAVIAANGPAVQPASAATKTIPIVFRIGADPVQLGLVASLSRPGRNLTGVSALNAELGPKRLELVREVVPGAKVIAALMNPTNPSTTPVSSELHEAARALGLQLQIFHAVAASEFEPAFENMTRQNAGALVIGNDAFFSSRAEQLAALSLRYRIPSIYAFHEFVAAGGLISYGGNIVDQYRLFGNYTGRILKGERPEDMPVQQTTKVGLIINMATAKTLGITMPLSLRIRADEVIE